MKIQDRKEDKRIEIETLDDLWYLKSILEKGDEITGVSYRRVKDDTKLRADKGERVKVKLKISLEDIEFSKEALNLRLRGKIKASSDENIPLENYHTIEAGINDSIILKKEKYKGWQLQRLKEAEKSSQAGIILIIAIEEGEAEFAVLRGYGMEHVLRITRSLGGKRADEKSYSSAYSQFISEVAEKIFDIAEKEDIKSVIIAGPGFAKDALGEKIKGMQEGGKKKIEMHIESAGSGGRAGVQEVLKKGLAEKIAKESRIAYETRTVEEVLKEIGRGGKNAAYGIKEVEKAVELCAATKVLVSESLLQNPPYNYDFDALIEKARSCKSEVLMVSSRHEGGEKLIAIGGIAALLRFPV